jgi:DNA-binding MarR family transcriptional regulator
MNGKSAAPGPRYQALLQLLRTAESIWNASRLFFERWDLSPSQFNVLNLLQDQPDGLSQTDLSRELIMHRSNVTGLVDRLEKRGLVERHTSTSDRRINRVRLTKSGLSLVREIMPEYYAAAERVWGDVPPVRALKLTAELQQLAQRAEQTVAN